MTNKPATVVLTYDPGDNPMTLDNLLGFVAIGLSAGCLPEATTVSWDHIHQSRLCLTAYPDDMQEVITHD